MPTTRSAANLSTSSSRMALRYQPIPDGVTPVDRVDERLGTTAWRRLSCQRFVLALAQSN